MVRLEDYVEKLFAEKPNLTRDGAVEELLKFKDPKTGKCEWRSSTIRNRVDAYLGKKRQAMEATKPVVSVIGDASHASAPEFEATKNELRIDPFSSKAIPSQKEIDEFTATITKMVSDQLSGDIATFKQTAIGLISEIKETVERLDGNYQREISQLKKEIAHGPIEYDTIDLRKTTLDALKDDAVAHKINDISDYIDSLRSNSLEYNDAAKNAISSYFKIVKATKASQGPLLLSCSMDKNEKFNVDTYVPPEQPKKKMPKKMMIILIGIGAIVGAIITYGLAVALHVIK